MSFNAKNLSYELEQPSFLRKLRGQYDRGESERHERPNPRPQKNRDGVEDDEPTYVDEDSNETVSKAEYEALVTESTDPTTTAEKPKGGTGGDTAEADSSSLPPEAPTQSRSREQLADIGARSKRKAVKAVGQDNDEGGSAHREKSRSPSVSKSNKNKKARKKVKLSFDDDEEEG
ncbi:MAG: hypothetical protein M4579_006883 [Chaenotheca gracillima]|nr:MAG: hypothetical protein M4579_006883 [Chaenotheca gracillima]